MAQEGMHSMNTKKMKGAILKIDLSKAYDKVIWLYIRMLLNHLGLYWFYQMGYELYHNSLFLGSD